MVSIRPEQLFFERKTVSAADYDVHDGMTPYVAAALQSKREFDQRYLVHTDSAGNLVPTGTNSFKYMSGRLILETIKMHQVMDDDALYEAKAHIQRFLSKSSASLIYESVSRLSELVLLITGEEGARFDEGVKLGALLPIRVSSRSVVFIISVF